MAVTNPDGSIILKTIIDTLGAEKGLNTLKSGISKFTKAMGAVGVAGASAVAMITKTAVEGYAEYEQLIGGVETLYGSKYKNIEEYIEGTGAAAEFAERTFEEYQNRQKMVLENANNAYKTAGISANEYMNTVNGFAASLTSSLGEYEWQAGEYADMIVTDMADNANKMGTSMEMIQNAYSGFAKQNYTMLDNLKLGYGVTKEEMERLLRDAEKFAGFTEGSLDVSNFADVADAIHIIQEEMGITGTTAKEASATIQGSASSMKASWENLVVGLADENADFDQLLQNFIDSVGTFAKNLIPRIKIALSGIVDLIGGLAPEIIKNLPNLIKNIVPEAINAVFSIIKAVVDALPQLIGFLVESFPKLIPQLINGLFDLFELLMNNFEEIIMPIIDALPLIIETLLVATIKRLPQIIVGLTKIVVSLAKATPTIFASFVKSAVNVFETLWESIKKVFSNVKGFFGGVWGNIKNVFVGAGNAIADAISGAVRGAINRVLSYAGRIINNFINGINTAISVINAIPGVSINKLNSLEIPQLAKGAVLPPNKPFLAMVGDQKSGTNIEAPLDTIIEAVKIAFGGSSGFNGRIEVPVYLGNRQIALAVREAENEMGTETVVGGFANAY
jgi:hypothetical protein